MEYVYKIYPAIGIARVGDADEYYIGPEEYRGLPILPDGKPFGGSDCRDKDNKIRRQGARFRVFKETTGGEFVEELTPGANGVLSIEWTVHLANKKSVWYDFQTALGETGYASNHPWRNAYIKEKAKREKMIIDPGPGTVNGPNQRVDFSRDSKTSYPATFPPETIQPFAINTIGSMLTDEQGRLIVVGGHGCSGTSHRSPEITDYANNDGWWDDTSDGPVQAKVHLAGGEIVEAANAWVLVAPPKDAPQIANLVTLHDTMFDVAVRDMGFRKDIYHNYAWNFAYLPDFDTEILPILERGNAYPWVVAIPPKPHDFNLAILGDPDPKYDSMRKYYYDKLRAPNMENLIKSPQSGHTMMPYLAGDDCLVDALSPSRYLTFTQTQYFMLQQWAEGKFTNGKPSANRNPGAQLTEAVLGNCVGGAFSPGIEMTWICRNTAIYTEPFRLKLKKHVPVPLSLDFNIYEGFEPGDATKFMAVPWQADFNECSSQPIVDKVVYWWPAQRPLWVYARSDDGTWKQVPWAGIDFDANAPDYLCFADDIEMVSEWKNLGFIIESEPGKGEPKYIEVARLLRRSEADALKSGDAE
jgi:hypothetical protein